MLLSRLSIVLLSLALSACDVGFGSESGGNTDVINISATTVTGGFPQISPAPANNASMLSCNQNPPPSVDSTINGRVEYERIPVELGGLNYIQRQRLPARAVVVEAVDASNGECSTQVVATALTNASGEYGLSVEPDQSVCVQVRAQVFRSALEGGAGWDIQVTDNTNNNAAYYLVDDIIDTPSNNPRRNFFAASGAPIGLTSYIKPRAAAPFAILDTVCESLETLVNVDNDISLPLLQIHWSKDNIASQGDPADGEIGGAFFRQIQNRDQQGNVISAVNEIYLLGDANNNTDEYDHHVITHEFGHYVFNNISRTDALGGAHGLADHLDMRVAFDEGLADAYSGIALDGSSLISRPKIYRDTLGVDQAFAFNFDLSTNSTDIAGWYSEASVFSLIYNLFDNDNLGSDQLSLGFAPIYNVLTSQGYKDSSAFISIFTFINQLKDQSSADLAIDMLMASENFESITDDFGSDESSGNNNVFDVVDTQFVYKPIGVNGKRVVCSNDQYGVYNKLSARQYLVFDAPQARSYTFTVQDLAPWLTPSGKPQLQIYQKGVLIAERTPVGSVIQMKFDQNLQGRYVLALQDLGNLNPNAEGVGRRCYAIKVE